MLFIVKEVCSCLGIRGECVCENVPTHGLRATMISLLTSAGDSDATIVQRTGHCNTSVLQNYHHLMGSNV